MLIEQIITELFNDPVPVYPVTGQPNMCHFTVNNATFVIAFVPAGRGYYAVVLSREDDGDQFQSRGDMGRDGVIVYSTVVNVVKKFLAARKPDNQGYT